MLCIGQPLLNAGDLNADPAVIPCFAKGISAGRFVDLALAYSLGDGKKPDATCKFKREDCAGSRTDFILGCSNALPRSEPATCPVPCLPAEKLPLPPPLRQGANLRPDRKPHLWYSFFPWDPSHHHPTSALARDHQLSLNYVQRAWV